MHSSNACALASMDTGRLWASALRVTFMHAAESCMCRMHPCILSEPDVCTISTCGCRWGFKMELIYPRPGITYLGLPKVTVGTMR